MLAVNVTRLLDRTSMQNGATKSHTMITYLEPALEQGQ